MKWFEVLVFLYMCSLLGAALAAQCGSQAGGKLCPGGLCCSKWGVCGSTPDYCAEGCQSQCHPHCGRQGGWAPCPGKLCCSKWGFCGSTPDYCAEGCQSQCRPHCGRQGGWAPCPGGLCCSQWGYCGSTPAYCAEGCQSQCRPHCGRQAGFALCPDGLCCSQWGYCGSTSAYCGKGCQSQCSRGGDLSAFISESLFNEMLKHSGDDGCHESFYTYNAFITAAKSFTVFGTTGDTDTRKREIAAFLAQTSHETNGGWLTATDEPYTWGYCWAKQLGNPGNYCVPSAQYPCAPGKKYYGRGPIQLKNNYNYGQAGQALGVDLLRNPDLVATDPMVSFKTAIWFWMTPQSPKPSCHDVITGQWMPSGANLSAGRHPGYGVITNIIIGGLECGKGPNPQAQDRIGFYKRYCDMLGVSYGDNLDCDDQRPFGNLLLPEEI